jgi:ribose transport system substrate-binding protein
MSSTESASTGRKFRFGRILVFGVIAAIGVLTCIMWAKGSFERHDKIAILAASQTPYWDPVEKGVNDAARDFGFDVQFVRSEPDEASENKHMQELLDSGIVGLVISPDNPDTQKDPINQAAGKVVVVTLDSDAPDSNRRGHVGTNNYGAGQVVGEQVRAAIPDGGQVIVYASSIEQTNARDRRQGLIDNLLDRPFAQQPTYDADNAKLAGSKYQIVATVTDGGAANQSAVQDAIKANPDVKCIVGLNSYTGDVAVKAVEAAGKKGQIQIVGFDETPQEQADVASGAIFSSVVQNQYLVGYESVRMLADLLRGVGQNVPARDRLTELPVMVMKPANIESLRAEGAIRSPTTAN